jgi:hypothetical protein
MGNIIGWRAVGWGQSLAGAARPVGRYSLLIAAVSVTACFTTDGASAQQVCPGVTRTGPAGVMCGANTGAITTLNGNAEAEAALENLRNKGQPAVAPIIVTKAATENNIQTSIWAEGTYLNENQSGTFNGTDIGARTRTWGGVFGVKSQFDLPHDTTLTLGLYGGEEFSTITMPLGDQTRTRSPNIAVFAEYDVGDSLWSELYYTHNWLHNSGLNCATAGAVMECALETATATDEVEGNVYYRFNPDAKNGNWWWEPTAGFVYDVTSQSMGISDETITRLQGGVNFGTSYMWGTVKVFPTLKALLFSDVSVTGGTALGGPPVATDQGQLWAKGVATIKFAWTKNFASEIEGQIYGTSGTQKIIDYELHLQLKYTWGGSELDSD